jgi:hypothetical protein
MARGIWVSALLVLVTAGCGTADQQAVRSGAAAPSRSPGSSFPGKCCVPPAEPSLKISARPKSGPVGTTVRLLITGCGEVDPTSSATVSFNNDALNTSARFNPNTVRDLGIHRGTRITLSYETVASDRTGGLGQFFVQCGQTVLETPFRVTTSASRRVDTGSAGSPCQAAQLLAKVFFVPAGTGSDEYRIRIRDAGKPCSLRGRPTSLYGVDAAGRVAILHSTTLSADDAAGMTTRRPARLTVSKAGEVVLVTQIGCPAAQRSRTADETFVSLQLGIGSGTIPVPFGGGPEPSDSDIWLPCGVAMSNFYAAA